MNCLKGPASVPPAGLNTCQEWDHGTGACAAPASRTLHNMMQKIYDSAHVVRKTKIGNLIKSYCCKIVVNIYTNSSLCTVSVRFFNKSTGGTDSTSQVKEILIELI